MVQVKFLRRNNVASVSEIEYDPPLSNHKYINTEITATDVDGHLDPDLEQERPQAELFNEILTIASCYKCTWMSINCT